MLDHKLKIFQNYNFFWGVPNVFRVSDLFRVAHVFFRVSDIFLRMANVFLRVADVFLRWQMFF